jgi:FdhD protein
MEIYRPQMTQAGMSLIFSVDAINGSGRRVCVEIPYEFPLTIYLDGHEVATLMTLGTHPEELVLGYLRNQGMIRVIEDIASVMVNWEEETARVATFHGNVGVDQTKMMTNRIVTSGCGQSMMFDCLLQSLYVTKLTTRKLQQSAIYSILRKLSDQNTIYRKAGSVHGCGLCTDSDVLFFVEDVGRHNAADVISGRMWLERIFGEGKLLYTTGRLTSEIVMKAAWMGISVLISKSGTTRMGLELARDLGMTMIGRVKKSRFLVYSGSENLIYDALSERAEERDKIFEGLLST